jgi:beta-mannosidase
MLPGIVADVDGTRPYWPGSPYSGSEDLHPNDPAHGCTHVWDIWNERDYVHYREHRPRFVSEFGFSGPANWATLEEYIRDRPLEPRSPGMVHHQRAADGEMKLDRGLEPRFDPPATMADWHFATQLNQARALTFGVEHFRSLKPYCMGSVVWQLNDCWPVSSWAAIDGAGRPKPAWYALRRSFAPQLLTIQPRGDGLAVVGVNDGSKPWRTPVTVERRDLDGRLLGTFTRRLIVAGLSAAEITIPGTVASPVDPASEVLVATADTGERSFWYYAEDKELRYPQPKTLTRTSHVDGQLRVQVEALTFIRDLTLLVDRVDPDARVDTMLVTLLPGESHEFVVTPGRAHAADERWTTAPALRCANELGVRDER